MKNSRFLERLLHTTQQLAAFHNKPEALSYLIAQAVDIVQAENGFILLTDTNQHVEFVATSTSNNGVLAMQEVSRTIIEQVRDEQTPLLITDAMTNPLFADAVSVQTLGLRSVMCVPMLVENDLIAMIYVENRQQATVFRRGDLETLQYFAGQTAVLLQNIVLADHLRASREVIVIAREEERRRLRHDLHDNIGPQIAALSLQLQALQNHLGHQPETISNLLKRANDISKDVLTELELVVDGLRPPALDELGLINALHQHLNHLNSASDIFFELNIPVDMPSLNAAVEVALYQIVREASTNTLRHSQAKHCKVSLHLSDHIKLTIVDDGGGIQSTQKDGVGLMSIRERVYELNGQFELQSTIGDGVKLTIIFPHHMNEE